MSVAIRNTVTMRTLQLTIDGLDVDNVLREFARLRSNIHQTDPTEHVARCGAYARRVGRTYPSQSQKLCDDISTNPDPYSVLVGLSKNVLRLFAIECRAGIDSLRRY